MNGASTSSRPAAASNDTPRAIAGTVLVADDDAAVRQLLVRTIRAEGCIVEAVCDGEAAIQAIRSRTFDLVVSDIDMPGRTGVELLRAIREHDVDVPVVLVTGAPRLETAMSAIEYGATHYLAKPVDFARLRSIIQRAIQSCHLARARRALVGVAGDDQAIGSLAALRPHFDRALATAFMVYQPIVRWSNRSTFAYEALVRSPDRMMPHPGALFDAAERLNRTQDVGRRVRAICAEPMQPGDDHLLFVNLHTHDLMDASLYDGDAALARVAGKVVLEITERARLESVPDVSRKIGALRQMGFRIALDDIGAGYAGLTSFVALEPNFMKLDRALIQGVHQSNTKMRLVGAMVRACEDLGVQVIAEGIETREERDALIELGCDLLQGFYFSKPEKPFARPSF